MSRNINLLSVTPDVIFKGDKNVRIVRIAASLVLVLFFLVATIIISLKFLSPIPTLEKEQAKLLSDLTTAQHQSKIVNLFRTKNRILEVQTLLNKRPDYEKDLAFYIDETKAGISVRTFKVDSDAFAVEVTAETLEPIHAFLNIIVKKAITDKKYRKVTLQNLAIDTQKNVYVAALVFEK